MMSRAKVLGAMKNEMRSGSATLAALHPRMQPTLEVPAQTGTTPREPGGFSRIRKLLNRLIERIDLSDFPGSCCG
jgi:hypothetical protein